MKIDWHRIITPRAWYSNYPTNWHWDRELQFALSAFNPIRASKEVVLLGKYHIWVENWPYAYGFPVTYPMRDVCKFLPSVKTRKLLRAQVLEHDLAQVGQNMDTPAGKISDFSAYKKEIML